MRRRRRIIHKIIFAIVILLLLSLSGICIYYGLYFNNLANPRNVIESNLRKVSGFSKKYVLLSFKYNSNDSFAVDGSIKYNLSSELYYTQASNDEDSLKKFNYIKNLNALNSTFTYKQDKTTKKVFYETSNKIGNEDLYSMKFYSEDSTKYYIVDNILTNYVNEGNFNFFENYGEGITTKDNVEYLYDYVPKAFANAIPEDEIKISDTSQIINGNKVYLRRFSVKFNNTVIRNTLDNFLDELRNDERANSIITNIYGDFANLKFDDEKFLLDSDESYTVSIYTDRLFYNPFKYEIIHIHGNDRKVYYLELNKDVYKGYVVYGDKIKYSSDITINNDLMEATIFDSKTNKIGSLKLSRDNTGIDFNYSLDDESYTREIIYSSKYTDVSKNHSYNNNRKLILKIIDDNVTRLSGNIEMNVSVSDDVSIMEDVSTSVLYSTLSDEVKQRLDNNRDRIRERMEK